MCYLAAFMTLLAVATTAMADEQVYKWTDDVGRVHYGAAPPPGLTAERIRIDTGSPAPTRAAEEATAATGEVEQKKTAAAQPAPAKAAATPEQCEIARGNLETLQQGGADRRFRKPDGTVIRFTPEELKARIDESRAFLDEHC